MDMKKDSNNRPIILGPGIVAIDKTFAQSFSVSKLLPAEVDQNSSSSNNTIRILTDIKAQIQSWTAVYQA